MNRPDDPRELLGGYATGTLTDEEKRRLYSAALEDQEIFNALAEEEALRELLADPQVRKSLLATLPHPKPAPPRRLWRRPAFLGLAASLFAILTTSVVLWTRFGTPVPAPSQLRPDLQADKALAEPSTGAERQKAAAPRAPEAPAPSRPQSHTPPLPLPPQEAPRPAAPVPAGSMVAAAPAAELADRLEPERASLRKSAAPREASKAPRVDASPGAAGAVVEVVSPSSQESLSHVSFASGPSKDAAGAPSPATAPARPECILERLAGGRIRLTVSWTAPGHLYVLKRSSTGVVPLAPRKPPTAQGSRWSATFEGACGESDILDLYLMPEAVADPASLPAEGPVTGYHRRLHPKRED